MEHDVMRRIEMEHYNGKIWNSNKEMEPDITSWNVKEWQCDGNKKEEQNGYACM